MTNKRGIKAGLLYNTVCYGVFKMWWRAVLFLRTINDHLDLAYLRNLMGIMSRLPVADLMLVCLLNLKNKKTKIWVTNGLNYCGYLHWFLNWISVCFIKTSKKLSTWLKWIIPLFESYIFVLYLLCWRHVHSIIMRSELRLERYLCSWQDSRC